MFMDLMSLRSMIPNVSIHIYSVYYNPTGTLSYNIQSGYNRLVLYIIQSLIIRLVSYNIQSILTQLVHFDKFVYFISTATLLPHDVDNTFKMSGVYSECV